MNICMLLAGRDFPPDIRVEKEARALTIAGHKIVIVCDHFLPRPSESDWNGCIVRRVRALESYYLKKINSLMNLVSFRDYRWYNEVSRLLQHKRIDVLHVHDLPMAGIALSIAKRYSIPLVLDLHENYPAAIQYYRPEHLPVYKQFIGYFYSFKRWVNYERRCALAANRVLVVVDEARERLVNEGIPANKITVIENTEDIDIFLNLSLDKDIITLYKNDFVISYIGGFGGRHRGLDTAISALPLILREIPNARLLLVGNGPIKPMLEKMVIALSLEGKVTFVDWQPFDKVPSFIAASKVCIVPHHSNPHTEATSPHKLFQYMLMGKPVVVSTCRPLRRIIEETGGGLVFEAGNSQALAHAVIQLKDERLQRRLGEAGRRAVLEKYNWGRTSNKLLRMYEQLVQSWH